MANASKLSDEEWNRLQDITERFERDCADAFPRDPAEYVPDPSDPLRDVILDEIIRIDLELHWRKGKGHRIEVYLERFPELLRREGRLLQLIEEEYRVRGHFGDRPDAEEFVSRFPEHKGWLESRLRPHGGGEFHTMNSTVEIPLASAGNLTKIRRIGEGGFGEVWECRAPGGVPVAVKRLFATVSPKFVEREKQSLDMICSGHFRHPFLLQVFGWWLQENQVHIVMELADESLDDRLKQAKAVGLPGLDADEPLKQIIRDAGEALDFLNFKCHILHRDVKPANMLLMGERLKLADFGLAKMMPTLSAMTGQTQGAGTPVFIAPEVVQGFQSMQSDQYSLAVSYCMLRTGRPLFRGTVKEIRDQHVHAKPSLEETILSRGEQRVLSKALSKEPTDRFRSSSEFVQNLLASLGDSNGSTSSKGLVRPWGEYRTNEVVTEGSEGSEPNFVPLGRQRFKRAGAGDGAASTSEPATAGGWPIWVWVGLVSVIFVLGLVVGGAIFGRQH
jgi:serine/threonine protein kinase